MTTKLSPHHLLRNLSRIEDIPLNEMLEEATFDSCALGICSSCGEYTKTVEPDCNSGFCEKCGTQTVVSCLVLAGII